MKRPEERNVMDKTEVDCVVQELLNLGKDTPFCKEEIERRYQRKYTKGQIERIYHRYRYLFQSQK